MLSIINGVGTFTYSFKTTSGGTLTKVENIPIEKLKTDKGQPLCSLTKEEAGVADSDSTTTTLNKALQEQMMLNNAHVEATKIKIQQEGNKK